MTRLGLGWQCPKCCGAAVVTMIDYDRAEFGCERGFGRTAVRTLHRIEQSWPTPPKKDERFPHTCPRCGQPSYNGLTVEHQDPSTRCT